MRELTLPNSLYVEKKKMSRTALNASLDRWKRTLCVSAVLGGIWGVVGMTLGLLSLLGLLKVDGWLDDLGTVSLVVAFPLIILAAHSLDKAYEIDKAMTIEYCRHTGMIVDEVK